MHGQVINELMSVSVFLRSENQFVAVTCLFLLVLIVMPTLVGWIFAGLAKDVPLRVVLMAIGGDRCSFNFTAARPLPFFGCSTRAVSSLGLRRVDIVHCSPAGEQLMH